MTNLLARALLRLPASHKKVAGVAVTYRRNHSSVEITAIPGFTNTEEQSVDGAVFSSITDDFLIEVTDLVLDGELTTPQRNDRIDWGERTFEVFSDGARRAYDYTDQYRTSYRVHTKEVHRTLG